jgi:plastocyanin
MGSSGGNGVTHTIIVAPTQGVLRYVPFATNASVGDTLMFMWGANNHTVTKSSQLQLCNKTQNAPFASGEQNKSFTFTQVVNDTNPIFFYCGTPGHCEKGMFGIVNPPQATNAANSVAGMMPAMLQNDSSMAAMASYSSMQTMNNSMAANWGSGMDMSAMPTWAMPYMAANVMYTRTLLAANPDVMAADGTVNMGNTNGAPINVPADITQAANNAANNSSSSTTSTATSSSSPSGSASPATAAKSNGARSLGSSGAFVGIVTILGAFLAL